MRVLSADLDDMAVQRKTYSEKRSGQKSLRSCVCDNFA